MLLSSKTFIATYHTILPKVYKLKWLRWFSISDHELDMLEGVGSITVGRFLSA